MRSTEGSRTKNSYLLKKLKKLLKIRTKKLLFTEDDRTKKRE